MFKYTAKCSWEASYAVMVNAVQAYAWTANGASSVLFAAQEALFVLMKQKEKKCQDTTYAWTAKMFKHMSSLTSLNSIYSLIKLCLIDVVDIPLESHVLYQHFYSNSLISTENAQKPFSRKRPVGK